MTCQLQIAHLPPFESLTASTSCRIVQQLFFQPGKPYQSHQFKSAKRYGVSELGSQSVSDKHCQWSDSGPIKTVPFSNKRDSLPLLKHVFKTCDISIEREFGIGIRAGDKKVVLNKRGGSRVPKIIKRCVFGLFWPTFAAKTDKESPKFTQGLREGSLV